MFLVLCLQILSLEKVEAQLVITDPSVLVRPSAQPSIDRFSAMYHRQSRMDVWQYYAVDRTGHFRPRVVTQPGADYFLYSREAYPWAGTHPLEYMPYATP